MNPSTEVVLCTYNGSEFIIEQLKSILDQTHEVDKISIYDDQSSDDTLAKIYGFINDLPLNVQRIFNVNINEFNLGYAKNFCSAIINSTEDILLLCDQDDVWVPKKTGILLSIFCNNEVDMVFSDGLIIDHDGQKISDNTVLGLYGIRKNNIEHFHENAFELLMKRNYINGAALAVRRVTAQNALPLPCDMPHDYWLAIWCALHNGIIAVPQPLYEYRQHKGNVIGLGSSNVFRILINVWRYCDMPREREARIWREVVKRISALPCEAKIKVAKRKLNWISRVVPKEKASWRRLCEIIISIINGSYQRFSPQYSLLRDVFSIIKKITYPDHGASCGENS